MALPGRERLVSAHGPKDTQAAAGLVVSSPQIPVVVVVLALLLLVRQPVPAAALQDQVQFMESSVAAVPRVETIYQPVAADPALAM